MSVIQENVSLKPFNTFHVDVRALYLAEMKDVKQIQDFLSSSPARKMPVFILGGGSNVLFAGDYNGMIVRPLITGIEKTGGEGDQVEIRAGAGENWDSFVSWCVDRSLGGIENLSLIPGWVGASPIQNIGAYGMEVREAIIQVEAINIDNGEKMILKEKDCRFGYRDSIFKHELRDKVIITHVTYRLSKHHSLKMNYADLQKELVGVGHISIKDIRETVIKIRRKKLPDPDEIGNAGSFFKNPVIPSEQFSDLFREYPHMPGYADGSGMVKLSAAWLIDQCGWKGKRSGNTGCYEKQPLILVNYGGATGKEILKFAGEIQKSVADKFSLRLEREVNVVI